MSYGFDPRHEQALVPLARFADQAVFQNGLHALLTSQGPSASRCIPDPPGPRDPDPRCRRARREAARAERPPGEGARRGRRRHSGGRRPSHRSALGEGTAHPETARKPAMKINSQAIHRLFIFLQPSSTR